MRPLHLIAPIVLSLTATAFAKRPEPGVPAPAFKAEASTGKTVQLSDFKGRTVVLAFFPKAFTGGCTAEMSGYRDLDRKFGETGAQVLGISMDDVATQKKFAESLKLPFPLLADPTGTVTKAYEVSGGQYAQRVTFVIGKDGKIKKVIEGKDAIDPNGALDASK